MKLGLAGVGLAVCALAATTAQSGMARPDATAYSYRVEPFDSIAAAGTNHVVVHVGGSPAVSARGPAETLDTMNLYQAPTGADEAH